MLDCPRGLLSVGSGTPVCIDTMKKLDAKRYTCPANKERSLVVSCEPEYDGTVVVRGEACDADEAANVDKGNIVDNGGEGEAANGDTGSDVDNGEKGEAANGDKGSDDNGEEGEAANVDTGNDVDNGKEGQGRE